MEPPVWARPLAQVEAPSGADFGLPLCPQDTCVALQALAEYAILSYAGGVNLTVSLASTNLDYQETFELHRGNQKLLQMAAVRVPMTRAGGRAARAAPPRCLSVPVCLQVGGGEP